MSFPRRKNFTVCRMKFCSIHNSGSSTSLGCLELCWKVLHRVQKKDVQRFVLHTYHISYIYELHTSFILIHTQTHIHTHKHILQVGQCGLYKYEAFFHQILIHTHRYGSRQRVFILVQSFLRSNLVLSFSLESSKRSCTRVTHIQFPFIHNISVLRNLSKAWNLAPIKSEVVTCEPKRFSFIIPHLYEWTYKI